MKIQISDSFTYGKLLRFTFPSIIMMVFTSIYVVVDGFFVSNFVGKSQFTAVNFIMPFLMILGAIGFMFGTGGSAIVAKTMGENKPEKAKEQFSLFVYTSAVCGIIISVLGIILIRPTAVLLGADSEILEHCVVYGRVILIALPFYILQYEFQSFFIAAGKPQLGLTTTVLSGVTNMVLDFLLIKVFSLGLVGAAAATAMSQFIGGVIPLIYFGRENSSTLRLKRTKFSKRTILNACINGSSELMSNISMSLLGMLYNRQLIRYAGNDGVAAYGVLMYVNFAFLSAFIGYSVGTAPVISYHYGAGNSGEIKSILGKSYRIIAVFAIIMFSAAELLGGTVAKIFVSYDAVLLALTKRGFLIYSFSFLFSGISIFGSGFFTALNNGLISALISFLRTLVFQAVIVLTLPLLFHIDGIWASVVLAEILSAILTIIFIVKKRRTYHY